MRRHPAVIAAVVAGFLVVIGGPSLAIFLNDPEPEPRSPRLDAASTASEAFLTRYVEPDGRVVHHDQGGTVSEGQAVAMLVSVAIGDKERFDSTWQWARENLRQPSGLFAREWSNGEVRDPQAATGADLDMARALSIASVRFGEERYAGEAAEIARAIADNLFAYGDDGRPVMIAGPWADDAPHYINLGYHSPRAEQELHELTGDPRWSEVQERQRRLVGDLIGTEEDPRLPPDWATVALDGTITPAGPPGDSAAPPRYSSEAALSPIRLAESCEPADSAQAARMWTVLNESRESRVAAVMSLDGEVIEDDQVAVAAVASAAAAKASGDTQQMGDLLDLATRLDAENPGYYGSAWVALGRIMLTTDWLGPCPD